MDYVSECREDKCADAQDPHDAREPGGHASHKPWRKRDWAAENYRLPERRQSQNQAVDGTGAVIDVIESAQVRRPAISGL